MNWADLSQTLMLQPLRSILLIVLALRLLLRPRKPKAIYAHFNRMINGTVFWPIVILLMGIYLLLLLTVSFKIIPDSDITIAVYIIALFSLLLLNVVYILYWSHPYSRKRTGIEEVDILIKRYKKLGEQVEDVWVPTLVLNGKRYRNAFYVGKEKEWIVIDEEGEVLRDEVIARLTTIRITHHVASGNNLTLNHSCRE